MRSYMDIRSQILSGSLSLPSQTSFEAHFGTTHTETVVRMFKSAWSAYLLNKGVINLTYWAKQFNSVEVFNKVLKQLCDNNWLVTHAIKERNWAEAELPESKLLTYVSPDELNLVRATNKFNKYVPEFVESKFDNLTKSNGDIKNTGLVRLGFKASSATPFQYDTDKLLDNVEAVIKNVNKGMGKVRHMFKDMKSDSASYDAVATDIVHKLITSPSTYTMGSNFSDSRGRAIKEGLSKVANPIGYKDFRSLLIIPEEYRDVADGKGVTAIALFVAELLGSKATTILDKELFGMECYHQHKLHSLDCAANLDNLTTEEEKAKEESRAESDRAELHENIWLERLYEDLDNYYTACSVGEEYKWSVPIEKDASASILTIQGLLLGEKRLLSMTNALDTGTLTDPWEFEGINRSQFKTAATPMLYGSSATPQRLWEAKGIKYTPKQVALYNKEMQSGALGVANSIKEFILRWVKPQEVMNVHIYEDKFRIECNKFKHVGDLTTHYDIYDSVDKVVRRLVHTDTRKVPDLERFKLFHVTLLIHSLDSQVLDFVMEKVMAKYQWGIDIHDACVCSPQAAEDLGIWYAEELDIIFKNRKTILTNFFNSVGIGAEAKEDWEAVIAKVQPVDNDFRVSPQTMK